MGASRTQALKGWRMRGLIVCAVLLSSLPISTAVQDPGDAFVAARPQECVILLHGLCRSAVSMAHIAASLRRCGYTVVNLDFASTRKSIEALAEEDLAPTVALCRSRGYARVHLVTHSMGGIVARAFLQKHALPSGSRVVMLAPPNQGSELTDWALRHMPRIYRLAGLAARELGTLENDRLNGLAPVAAPVGIIAGCSSWNPLFSAILPGKDDGKVAVQRTRLAEMADFLIADDTHMMLLYDQHVHTQIIHFLRNGRFERF